MPLSEHEQRMLDQIERSLYTEDPKFAQAVRSTDPHVRYKRRLVKALVGFVAGVCLLMAGVISKIIIVGVAGFVVMLACCVWGLSSWKRTTGAGGAESTVASGSGGSRPSRQSRQSRQSRSSRSPRSGFMDRIEERWRRRREQGGQ